MITNTTINTNNTTNNDVSPLSSPSQQDEANLSVEFSSSRRPSLPPTTTTTTSRVATARLPPTTTTTTTTTETDDPRILYSAHKTLLKIDPTSPTYGQTLFTIAIGLNDEEILKSRVNNLVKTKVITKTGVSPRVDHLRKEVKRRYAIIIYIQKNIEKRSKKQLLKAIHANNWSKSRCEDWLTEHKAQDVDQLHVISKINTFVCSLETAAENEKAERNAAGGGLNKPCKRKLRLIEALNHPDYREKVFDLHKTETRPKHDARNSGHAPKSYYELVAEKYNDEKWIPMSEPFPTNDYLCSSFPLPLQRESGSNSYQLITAQKVKEEYRDFRGDMNKFKSNWGNSGNGQFAQAGKEIRFRNVNYRDNDVNEDDMQYLGDDRFDYCQGHLHIFYFWGLADALGLLNIVSSSIGPVGLDINKDPKSTRDLSVLSARKKNKDQTNAMLTDLNANQEQLTGTIKGLIQSNNNMNRLDRLNDDKVFLYDRIRQMKQDLNNLWREILDAQKEGLDEEFIAHLRSQKETLQEDIKDAENEKTGIFQAIEKANADHERSMRLMITPSPKTHTEQDNLGGPRSRKKPRVIKPSSSKFSDEENLAHLLNTNDVSKPASKQTIIDLANKENNAGSDSDSSSSDDEIPQRPGFISNTNKNKKKSSTKKKGSQVDLLDTSSSDFWSNIDDSV